MMKRLLAALLAGILCFSAAGCGNTGDAETKQELVQNTETEEEAQEFQTSELNAAEFEKKKKEGIL